MSKLHIEPLALENFTFVKKAHLTSASHRFMLAKPASTNLLVAEASDFGPAFHVARLYDDACDEGIAIRSHHTGAVRTFALTEREVRDGDLVAWHFAAVDGEPAMKVTIFND